MSTIDQAFIRAYHDELQPAAHPSRDVAGKQVATGSLSAPGLDATNLQAVYVDTGAHGKVPPPHAAFGRQARVVRELSHPLGETAHVPLSAFSAAAAGLAQTAVVGKPALEVDAVRWPAVCERLLKQHSQQLEGLSQELRAETAAGRRVIAIAGTRRDEGRTTLTLCLARQLATANLRVAVVDADFDKPELARQLSVSVARGWEMALAGEESVWELMIESLGDRLSILPLAGANVEATAPQPYRIGATLGELAGAYELVLVDAGPLELDSRSRPWLLDAGAGVDSILLAHNVRDGRASLLAAACLRLTEAGRRQIGIAELMAS